MDSASRTHQHGAARDRQVALNAAAIETAQRLVKSDSRAAQWVGNDSLKELACGFQTALGGTGHKHAGNPQLSQRVRPIRFLMPLQSPGKLISALDLTLGGRFGRKAVSSNER